MSLCVSRYVEEFRTDQYLSEPDYCASLLGLCPRLQSVTLVFADRDAHWGAWGNKPAHPIAIFITSMPCFVPLLVFERGSTLEDIDPLSSDELEHMELALQERFGASRPGVQLRVRSESVVPPRTAGPPPWKSV